MDDTIVAISTVVGEGAINIIRLSGKDSINIVSKIFKGKNLLEAQSHTINYGKIIYKNEIIDEVLVSIFLKPKTYTKENIVEINCHGSIASTNKILEIVLNKGARLAEPGEFLKRAFLNGRIDLIEAEAVGDLIKAKTEKSRKLSMSGINKNISKKINNLKNDLIELMANIEVNIDYPEYEDALKMTNEILKIKINKIETNFIELLKKSNNSKIIKNGIKVGIIGKPNVGKSSMLNNLLGYDKAIVTNIKGTTRDIVEGTIIINGILVKLIDTAGIRETENIIEKIGVDKSIEVLKITDLNLLLLDSSEQITEEDQKLIKIVDKEKTIIVLNKSDLENKIDMNYLRDYDIVYTSTLNEEGTKNLINKIENRLKLKDISDDDYTYLSNSRQIALLNSSIDIIKDIKAAIKNNIPIDLIEIDIKRLYEKLGEITGDNYKEDLINKIFSKFCLGK